MDLHLQQDLTMALQNQNIVGWVNQDNLFEGFISKDVASPLGRQMAIMNAEKLYNEQQQRHAKQLLQE
jgi:hypothetical protein